MSVALRVPGCPEPPTWSPEWAAIERSLPLLADLAACPQDPRYHAEGDVLTHTRLACAALAQLPAWRALPEEQRQILFAACLLHDVGKAERTRMEEGRITSRGHAARGATRARQSLAALGAPCLPREAVVALVRLHPLPAVLLDRADGLQRLLAASLVARCDHLALLAEADARGRVIDDAREAGALLERIELFRQWSMEQGCLDRPASFPSDCSRFEYFRRPRRGLPAERYDDRRGEVVLLSGLPGAGKDHLVGERLLDWEQVSLDAIRRELGVPPTAGQGGVVRVARERARELLRAGRPFVWNATNLTRRLRGPLIDLCAGYRARVRILYVEAPLEEILERNRRRREGVPEPVVRSLLAKMDFPDLTEAHAVEYVV
jgi:putative nucleotidyltransferase with HDIG domain